MFDGCKLDSASVKNIINNINRNGNQYQITLGIGCENTDTDKKAFAAECGYNSMNFLLREFEYRGWIVTAQFNGRPTTTYSMSRTTEPYLPVFVKLEEVEETSDKFKSFHTHTSLDGTKKFRLNYFHMTTGSTEGYTQYASLEEAIETLNIKPVERN